MRTFHIVCRGAINVLRGNDFVDLTPNEEQHRPHPAPPSDPTADAEAPLILSSGAPASRPCFRCGDLVDAFDERTEPSSEFLTPISRTVLLVPCRQSVTCATPFKLSYHCPLFRRTAVLVFVYEGCVPETVTAILSGHDFANRGLLSSPQGEFRFLESRSSPICAKGFTYRCQGRSQALIPVPGT